MSSFEENLFTYRITGPQSIERLDPLLHEFNLNLANAECVTHDQNLNFVWETTCEKEFRDKHKHAIILNKLNNTQIIESKSSFAFLQLTTERKFLETYVASNAANVQSWATKHWNTECSEYNNSETDWWAVKASNGNGGKDIWIVNQDTYEKAMKELPANEEYVIQR